MNHQPPPSLCASIEEVGLICYGEHWRLQMARALHCHPGHIDKFAATQRTWTQIDAVRRDLAIVLRTCIHPVGDRSAVYRLIAELELPRMNVPRAHIEFSTFGIDDPAEEAVAFDGTFEIAADHPFKEFLEEALAECDDAPA